MSSQYKISQVFNDYLVFATETGDVSNDYKPKPFRRYAHVCYILVII